MNGSHNSKEISIKPHVACCVQPAVRIELTLEFVVIHMIDFNSVETEGFLGGNSSLEGPLLSFYELSALFLFGPIRFHPFVNDTFALVRVNFLQLEIVILRALEPPKLTVLYVPKGGEEEGLADVEVGGPTQLLCLGLVERG